MTEFRRGRAYDPRTPDDGARILVDRLWPRGLTKEAADLDLWPKDATPSTELRKWFHANPDRVEEFAERYRAELADAADALDEIRTAGEVVTLLTASNDGEHVKVLLEVLDED
ncbi:DUF488 family protein [Aeromicrobium panaciterrae]|uniref:DUF488 domain-containing protein n=1 Tax=Aeromicrobium panaciterrae TaxID=363861 RepID=UPI0031CEAA42